MTAATAIERVVLDSSAWLEYLTSEERAEQFAPYLEGSKEVLVPTMVLYEVTKVLLVKRGKTLADMFLSEVLKRILVSFDEDLALEAAELSIAHKLAMADAIIYATALHHCAPLITSDSHLANLPGVTLI